MSAPVPGKFQIPSDAGNTGAKIRTQSRVIGADTVHEYMNAPVRRAAGLGVYAFASAAQTPASAAQNATSSGFAWLHVPTAITGKKCRIRKLDLEFTTTGTTAMPTSPRIGLGLFTFTGAASGASIAPAKTDRSGGFPSPVLDIRTIVTGLTVSLDPSPGSLLAAAQVPAMPNLTAVGFQWCPTVCARLWGNETLVDEDEMLVLAPGEGVCIYQLDAGTASDVRRFIMRGICEDIDTA